MKNSKKIGIWGYGLTGKSAINYFHKLGYELAVLEKKELQQTDIEYLNDRNISISSEHKLDEFLKNNEYILPSPGIDLRPHSQFKAKWLNELDLFYDTWQKPIIAVTGSIGKTTITYLLAKLLENVGKKIAMGGNIGIPVFDLLGQKDAIETAVLEISSFQLELTKKFAPTLAIWTNLHPNHLDRHGSEQEYFDAKAKMLAFQTSNHKALIPFEFRNKITTKAQVHYFDLHKPSEQELQNINQNSCVYYFDNESLVSFTLNKTKIIINRNMLPIITFEENWLILIAALDVLGLQIPDFSKIQLSLPEHRLEKVATIDGIDFYNDSKSTTAQSTLAAVNRLQQRPILLLLGGKGKGVSREPLIKDLQGKVKKIYCFGGEAQELHNYCIAHGIASSATENLDVAFDQIIKEMKSGDQVVLSPAGTSYDLYKIFSERGDHFKRLVEELRIQRRV